MSLYYRLLFIVLIIETIIFALLAVPLPTRIRRPLTKALSMPFTSPTLQTVIKVVLGFVLVLFFDSINKVYQISKEYEHVKSVGFAHDRTEILSRQFLAQRNMYLTGITLFLTFTIVRTFNLVLELFALKEANARRGVGQSSVDEEERLSKLIREKDEEIKLLKEQADALAKEI